MHKKIDFAIHDNFKLNGIPFKKEQIIAFANNDILVGEDYKKVAANFILDWFDANEYIEISTSGTTGPPKRIRVLKQAMINSAFATGLFFDLKPGDTALNCLSASYIAGKMMFVRAFVLGLDLHLVAPSANPLKDNPSDFVFVAMVPLQVESSIAQLSQIKKLIIGGAKLNSDLKQQILSTTCQAYETYGMTETVSHIAAKKVAEKSFTILSNIEIFQDNRSCLIISAPNLNVEKIVTNDIIEMISDNQFIWIGRYDSIINSGGVKLIPEQIEEKLSKKIANRFFVFGVKDKKLGEKLILFIEGAPYDIEPTIFEYLDKYEKPKEINFIPHFIETETGKIKRKEVVNLFYK